MKQWSPRGAWKTAQYALTGAAVTALITLLCFRLGLGLGVAAPAFLLIVVLQSLTGDFIAAGIVSLLAAACLDYYFTEPLFAFRMTRPSDMFALAAFLITALVITQLVSRLRIEIRFTTAQKERLDQLYQLSQQLLRLDPEAPEEEVLEPFHRLFGVTAIARFDGRTGETRMVGTSRNRLAERTRDAYMAGKDSSDTSTGIAAAVHCLRLGNKVTGSIGFESLQDPEQHIAALAALTNAHLEKTEAFHAASAAAAAVQAEEYRSAILDALAHEFKTPLATILAAAGGIREVGSLSPEQIEMTETVESEADRLGRLATRLLRVARLDREEVRPRMELLDMPGVVRNLADQYARRWPDRRVTVTIDSDASEGAADPELFRLALSQLLDNACKYSPPGTTVDIALKRDSGGITVEVSNTGAAILPSEERLIFERFYRGSDAKRHTAGSGLGLYVARKIALAHGGSLSLAPDAAGKARVTFRMTIPGSQVLSGYAIPAN